MSDEAKETAEEAAEVSAEAVAPGSVESDGSDKPEYVTRSDFDSFKAAVEEKIAAMESAVPVAVGDEDATPVRVPWTHRHL